MVFRRLQVFRVFGGRKRQEDESFHNEEEKGTGFLDSIWRREFENPPKGCE